MENTIDVISEEERTLQEILPKFPFIRFPLFNIIYETELLGLSLENDLEIFSKIRLSLLKKEYLQTWQNILINYSEKSEEKQDAILILTYLKQEESHALPSDKNLLWKVLWKQSQEKIYTYFYYKRTQKIMPPKSIMRKMRKEAKQCYFTLDINIEPLKNLQEFIRKEEYHTLKRQEFIAHIQALIPLSWEFEIYKIYDSQNEYSKKILMLMDYFFIRENPMLLKLLV